MQESCFLRSSLRSGAARAAGSAALRRDRPESVAFWRALFIGGFGAQLATRCGMIATGVGRFALLAPRLCGVRGQLVGSPVCE